MFPRQDSPLGSGAVFLEFLEFGEEFRNFGSEDSHLRNVLANCDLWSYIQGMTGLSLKQREILNREGLVLKAAREILLKRGYHGLTMARIATAAGCPKATVYKHFPCKEEVILALATESVEVQYALVERAGTFRGRPRERMAAVAVATQLFSELYADDSRIFQVVNGEAIFQKASEKSIWRLRALRVAFGGRHVGHRA